MVNHKKKIFQHRGKACFALKLQCHLIPELALAEPHKEPNQRQLKLQINNQLFLRSSLKGHNRYMGAIWCKGMPVKVCDRGEVRFLYM